MDTVLVQMWVTWLQLPALLAATAHVADITAVSSSKMVRGTSCCRRSVELIEEKLKATIKLKVFLVLFFS